MSEEFISKKPPDAIYGDRNRSLVVLLCTLPLLAIPLSVIANRGLVPLAILLALLGLVAQFRCRQPYRHQLGPLLPFALLLIWAGLSTVWSYEPKVSLLRWIKLIGHFLLGAVLLAALGRSLVTNAGHAWATRAALLGSAVALVGLTAHSLTGGALLIELGLKTPHPDPQILLALTNPAATVVAVFAAPVTLLVYRRYGVAAMLVTLAVITGVVVAFSESNAAKVGLGTALAVGGVVLWQGRRTLQWLALAFVVSVLVMPALRVIDPAPFALLRNAAADHRLTLPGSILHRTYIYDFVLNRIAERPLLGWGLGTSRVLPGGSDRVPDPNLKNREFLPLHPHNSVLQVWVELGVVGALGFAAIIWLVLTAIRRHAIDRSTAASLTAALTAYMTIGQFAFGIWSSWWIATGILAAATAIGILDSRLCAGPYNTSNSAQDERQTNLS
jgi:O-antigen ligase